MLPSPADLQYFMEIAESQNLSRAAERLGIRQPSLSLSLKRLEDSVGRQLVVRSKTGVTLTPAGKRLAQKTQFLLGEWNKLRHEAQQTELEVSGRFSIGCHPSVALYTLPYFTQKLLSQHPQLEIFFEHDLSRKVTEAVISRDLDFAIAVNPVPHPDLVIRELGRDRVTFWQHKKHKPLPTLIYDPSLTQSQDLLRRLKTQKAGFERHIHSNNLEVIASLISAGAGVGILPSRVAQRVSSQNLVLWKSLSKVPEYQDRFCLIYRSDLPKTEAVKAITGAIRESLLESQ